jgi:plasmid stabilization system protein ParE
MGHRLSPRAQSDIDDIAYYVAVESGSLETADRLIESTYRRFLLLDAHPYAGRRRDDLRQGLRIFLRASTSSSTVSMAATS